MIILLTAILFGLLCYVGKEKGIKTFFCIFINYLLVLIYTVLIAVGCNAILISFVICMAAALVSLFITNGKNVKTVSAFISVVAVLAVCFVGILIVGKNANIQGFTLEKVEEFGGFELKINCSMTDVIIGMIMVCSIGTLTDTAISVSTAMNEVLINNPTVTEKELFTSGMNVGRDILSTTVNTLVFAFFGGFVGFFYWHYKDSFGDIVNYKLFAEEVIELFFCCAGSVLVIPVTAFVTSKMLVKKNNTDS